MRRNDDTRADARELDWSDSGWIGAGPDDDLDARLAAEHEPFDERRPHVLTVVGPIAPDALGVTLVGGWDHPIVAGDGAGVVLHEHEHLYAAGVRALVDLGSGGTAQDNADLAWVSARSPLHVVAGGPAEPARSQTGTDQPRVGLAKISSLDDLLRCGESVRNWPVFLNAAGLGPGATTRTGLRDGAVDRSRLTVVADATAERAEWEPALEAGAWVALILPTVADSERLRVCAGTVRDLVGGGYGDRVLLGYRDEPLALVEHFPLALMEAGLAAVEVRRLLVDNPAQALTVAPAGAAFAAFPTI